MYNTLYSASRAAQHRRDVVNISRGMRLLVTASRTQKTYYNQRPAGVADGGGGGGRTKFQRTRGPGSPPTSCTERTYLY